MKYFFFTLLLCMLGMVYINYQVAKDASEDNVRFVISQNNTKNKTEKKAPETMKVAKQAKNDFSASILSASETLQKQDGVLPTHIESTPSTPLVRPIQTPASSASTPSQAPSTFQIEKSTPGQNISTWSQGQAFVFVFNQAVNLDSFFSHFTITPSPDGKFSGDITFGGNNSMVVVTPIPMLKENTLYHITLKKGLSNLNKTQEIQKDYSFSVTIVK